MQPLTLAEFLSAPADEVAKVAPRTLVWTVEGTRRSAALAGVPTVSEEYPRWSLLRMIECVDVMFRHGVEHVFTPLLSPSQFAETSPGYRERLFDWVALMLSDPKIRGLLIAKGWRVRLLGADSLPELRLTAERLSQLTPSPARHTLWISVVAESGATWTELLDAVLRSRSRTREQLIEALYGEAIPLATLLLAFGKPVVSPDQLPLALLGKVNCYWTQRPGYRLAESEFRTVLYDAAFVRSTWLRDKTGRAESAQSHRAAWEHGPTLGLGMRLGPHWYPMPFQLPDE